MQTDLFDFELPHELIATRPLDPRDAARMLVVAPQGIEDSHVARLPDFFAEGDVMVFNNTKVIPARLQGRRIAATELSQAKPCSIFPLPLQGEGQGGGLSAPHLTSPLKGGGIIDHCVEKRASIEVTLHKPAGDKVWWVFAKPGKKLRVGDTVVFADDFSAIVKEKRESGEICLQFECGDLFDCLGRYGSMPLPPYMKREAQAADRQDYQTVYAEREGAVAAPTAGLHFTARLLAALRDKKVRQVFITLHVGAGTFLPVKAEDTRDHRMHSEYAEITPEAAGIINDAKRSGKRIIAVGTTSLRALESAAGGEGMLRAFTGETDIFITPGYRFKIVDVLMTNFHLPRSTLFMLVSAFCGLETMQEAYRHAIAENYRFYSYGDASLLYKKDI